MVILSVELWLVIGIICLITELTILPNIGLLFLGFSAFSICLLLGSYPDLLPNSYIILAYFGLLSLAWFAALWWPLKRYIYGKPEHQGYCEMIGSQVIVYSKIAAGQIGQVKWSGTIMNAKLSTESGQLLEAWPGQTLYIMAICGNILICSPDLP